MYLQQLTGRKTFYDESGNESVGFSLDVMIANGICFASGFLATYFFVYKFIPGLKD